MREPFSVLMSIYYNTTLIELTRCLDSVFVQTEQPDEVMIVKDGPIKIEVQSYLDTLDTSQVSFYVLNENQGLGVALAKGLGACRNAVVARMDSDDYCADQYRFDHQINFLRNHPRISVCGGCLLESYNFNGKVYNVKREQPESHVEILKYAKRRNPLNHQTVMYRREHVQAAGGYADALFFEDYYLWARMLQAGYRFANLPIVLVKTELNDDFFERRGGLRYISCEAKLAYKLFKIKFMTPIELIIFTLQRLPMRCLPLCFRREIYLKLLRKI